MTLEMSADANKLEQIAADDPARLPAISNHAREHGVISHRFYATDDGTVMVVDEWPDAESFQDFFDHMQGAIGPLMQEVGAGPPTIRFWRKLETGDDIG
jgi:hypothetical protein